MLPILRSLLFSLLLAASLPLPLQGAEGTVEQTGAAVPRPQGAVEASEPTLVSRRRAQAPAATEIPVPPDSLVRPPMVLRFWPESRRLAERLAEQTEGWSPLPGLPPDALTGAGPVLVDLAPDERRFHALTGGLAPEWGAGVAFPAEGRVVLPAYASSRGPTQDLGRVLRHELAHVALSRHLAPVRAPRWFDEGYARWAAGELDASAAWKLRLAFALDRAPSLDSLTLSWPLLRERAEVAYLLSTTAIGYLMDRSGERGLRLFLDRWAETGSLEQAMRRTYGVTLGQFEEHWRREVKQRYGWGVLLTHSLVFWFMMATLLLALVVIRRRRDRERMRRLRANEPPDDPAYWLMHPEEEQAAPEGAPVDGADGSSEATPGNGAWPTRGTGLR